MENNLLLDGGLVTYRINGKCEILFNPSDINYLRRINEAFEKLSSIYDKYANMEATDDEVFQIARERDEAMVTVINEAVNADINTALDGISICAFAGGLPIWLNLILALIDTMDDSAKNIEKEANEKIKKYTKKYSRFKS